MKIPMKISALPIICLLMAAWVVTVPLAADEGMWQPHQLPKLTKTLQDLGLEIPPESLSDLTSHPMNAVISLGGCSASFVSPKGLVVTNHHCAAGALQYNSTEDENLLVGGFLAEETSEEIFAGPGSRVLVTVAFDNVSEEIRQGLGDLSGTERYQAIEDRQKAMIADCESDPGYRCRVASFYGGLEYYRIKQLEILDVRLVYAPKGSVGSYGGDIDNWMWPRHTGDFSFYRAYVGPDGRPAEFHEKNVPYEPKHHLKISADGLDAGDFVMVVGYPGGTSRYALAVEVENQFEWVYPVRIDRFEELLAIIEEETAERPDAAIKYAGLIAGLNNATKNYHGMITGYAKSDVVERKEKLEADLLAWIEASDERRARYAATLGELESLIAEEQAMRGRGLDYEFLLRRASLLSTATRLYRLAKERQKPDAEREPGFQERDLRGIREGLVRLDRSFDPAVDRALFHRAILNYAALPEDQRVDAFDAWLGLGAGPLDPDKLAERLAEMYAESELADEARRLAWLDAAPADFEASDDPFVELTVALYPSDREMEDEEEARAGRETRLRPAFMRALIDFLGSQGKAVYPDANGTLRVTVGTIQGYEPKDAVRYIPFTTAQGLLQKETGEDPFDSPPEILAAVRKEHFGRYEDEDLGSLPINFLSNVDTTGGNSGSPTLNGRGELVGLLFDGNWESIIADWDYIPPITRSIHVDARYLLWIMDHIDGADHLLEEMGLEPAP